MPEQGRWQRDEVFGSKVKTLLMEIIMHLILIFHFPFTNIIPRQVLTKYYENN